MHSSQILTVPAVGVVPRISRAGQHVGGGRPGSAHRTVVGWGSPPSAGCGGRLSQFGGEGASCGRGQGGQASEGGRGKVLVLLVQQL